MKTIIFILAISALAAPIYTVACSPAITGCDTCKTGGTECNKALAGYFLLTTTQVPTLCANGKGKAADAVPAGSADAAATGTDGVAVCSVSSTGGCNVNNGVTGGAGCINCAAGYYLSAAGTCTMCASGKGKAADSTVPAVDATGATCVNCAAGIASCKGTGATDALYCLANYWYASNACTACEMGKVKAAGTATPASAETKDSCAICAKDTYYTATGCTNCPAGKTRAAPTTAPTAVEKEDVCTAAAAASSATLIQALCGASVAAYALF